MGTPKSKLEFQTFRKKKKKKIAERISTIVTYTTLWTLMMNDFCLLKNNYCLQTSSYHLVEEIRLFTYQTKKILIRPSGTSVRMSVLISYTLLWLLFF